MSQYALIRNMNKVGLTMLHLDSVTNLYDMAIDDLVQKVRTDLIAEEKDIKAGHERNVDWNHLSDEEYEGTMQRENVKTQKMEYVIFLNDQLQVLLEMKIVYAFKNLEINMKSLLQKSYSLESSKDFYRWENMVKFLRQKNIAIEKLEQYSDIVELKATNNHLKHSGDNISSLSRIDEFKSATSVYTYNQLEAFYNRIKRRINPFLENLARAIFKDLYEFDDKKLEQFADNIKIRMEKSDGLKLAKNLQNYYENENQIYTEFSP